MLVFLFSKLLLGVGLALGTYSAAAQAPSGAPRGYDFRTITIIKSPYRNDCRLLLTPAFEGKTELKLEEEYTLSSDKYREHLQANTALVNQLLSDLSVAGWELVGNARGAGRPTTSGRSYPLPPSQGQKLSCCV